jgi:hypothetical protein
MSGCIMRYGDDLAKGSQSSLESFPRFPFNIFVCTLVDSDEAKEGVPPCLVLHGTRPSFFTVARLCTTVQGCHGTTALHLVTTLRNHVTGQNSTAVSTARSFTVALEVK